MENAPAPTNSKSQKPAFTFGQQFLVFLLVLNIGALYALVNLYWKVDRLKGDLEQRRTEMIRDSLVRSQALDSARLLKPVVTDTSVLSTNTNSKAVGMAN